MTLHIYCFLRIMKLLDKMFTQNGLPETVSDNGPQFRSEELKTFFVENSITHRKCSLLLSHAIVEQQNRSMLEPLKIARAQDKKMAKGTKYLPQSL